MPVELCLSNRLLIAVATWATLQSAALPQTIVVRGNIDCAQWLEARQAKTSAAYEGFVVGVVDGLSAGSGVSLWDNQQGFSISNDQAFLWSDEYCRKNPLKHVFEGLTVFANEVSQGSFGQHVTRRTCGEGAEGTGTNLPPK
jgi:hypothetical protein